MLVSEHEVIGTVGGGQLEWQAIQTARALLAPSRPEVQVERLVLGADLGQCCGGVVDVWIERLTAADESWLRAAAAASAGHAPARLRSTLTAQGLQRAIAEPRDSAPPGATALEVLPQLTRGSDGQIALLERLDTTFPELWLFGAGYVGQAVARLCMELPFRLTWLDARAELFPSERPGSVQVRAGDPLLHLASAPAGARFLVMTHSHALDYALCHALLVRNDFAWLGLIGSQSKAARFRSRLARSGIDAARLSRLVCPIGVSGITSKWPAAIAISIAAQLLQEVRAGANSAADPVRVPISASEPATDLAAASCAGAPCAQCGPRGGRIS